MADGVEYQSRDQEGTRSMRKKAHRAIRTPDGFWEWLSRKPYREIVGRSGVAEDCPLARYLAEATGKRAGVGIRHSWIQHLGAPFFRPLAPWARSFTANVDGRELIQAGQARVLLEGTLGWGPLGAPWGEEQDAVMARWFRNTSSAKGGGRET